jgi:Aspartyl/Asparaginyl beta-hydroxylase
VIRRLVAHARACRDVRRLLREHDTENLRELYWYDLRLADAVRWRGIARVALWNLFRRRDDEIARNYDVVNLYYAPPPGDGRAASAPTVWSCRRLATRPWFDGPHPAREALEAHAPEIIAEYRAAADRLVTHPDNASLMSSGRWTGMFLYQARGVRNEELARLCPRTTAVVDELPLCRNFGFVMFSGMEPGSHVEPHTGSSNLRLRVHLGVDVPEPDKARLRVGTEWRPWAQGRTLAFDDSFEHEVVHEGLRDRVVLVVDVWHPGLTAEDVAVLGHPVFQRFGKA